MKLEEKKTLGVKVEKVLVMRAEERKVVGQDTGRKYERKRLGRRWPTHPANILSRMR